MQPLIGISCSYDQKEGRYFLAEAYVNTIARAGGTPVILPGAGSIKKVRPYMTAIKGLLLAGGGDIDPTYFGEEPAPGLGEVTPDRDSFEIMLVKAAVKKGIPVLGICRGIQVINVAFGGTLFQHIPAALSRPLKHQQSAPRWHPTHKVAIESSSKLARVLKASTLKVNSFHHQAVRDPAPGFMVSAISSDGVIEGLEHTRHDFVIGVQWHPEGMAAKDRKSRLLFKALIAAAKKY